MWIYEPGGVCWRTYFSHLLFMGMTAGYIVTQGLVGCKLCRYLLSYGLEVGSREQTDRDRTLKSNPVNRWGTTDGREKLAKNAILSWYGYMKNITVWRKTMNSHEQSEEERGNRENYSEVKAQWGCVWVTGVRMVRADHRHTYSRPGKKPTR